MCSRFDQDGYRVLSWLEALLYDHQANLGDFDDVLSLYWQHSDVLHINIPREVGKSKVEQNYQLLAVSKPARRPILHYRMSLPSLFS